MAKNEITSLRDALVQTEEKLKILLLLKILMMIKTSLSKSKVLQVAMKVISSQGIFLECIHATRKPKMED
jgi:hypothetical protein